MQLKQDRTGTSSRVDNLPPAIINDPMLPLVSIVTPSYNQGRFIRATIESVLTQDYPNIEYWVIDGGSTDETVSILKEYEQDRRFHWISEPDQGQSDAINKGLDRCQGVLFSWLNSDDLLLAGALHHVANAWQHFSQPAIIYGLARLIDETNNDLGYCPMQSSSMNLEKLLWTETSPVQPATFLPTNIVQKVGGVDPSLHFLMDLDLLIRVGQCVPFVHVPCDVALFRLHSQSKTVSLASKFVNDIDTIMHRVAQQGLLPPSQANSRSSLYAARIYLLPDVRDIHSALIRIRKAVNDDYTVFFRAIFIFLKGIIRLFIGEKHWSKIRLLKTRLS